jgi:HEAT repeat protein
MTIGRERRIFIATMFVLVSTVFACTLDPGYKGRSSADWIRDLTAGTATQRVDAAFALGHVLEMRPNSRQVTRALVGALRDTVDDVRVAAATGLRSAGSEATAAIPLLAGLLADTAHAEVRVRGVSVLGDLGRNAPAEATELLRDGLHDPAPEVRAAAALAIRGLGEGGRGAVPDLIVSAKDPIEAVRLASVDALASAGVRLGSVTQALVAALSDTSSSVRRAAAIGLTRVMTASPQVTGALITVAHDRSTAVRVAAVYALGMIGDPAADGTLRGALADCDSTVRQEAAHALTAFHRRGGRDPVVEP